MIAPGTRRREYRVTTSQAIALAALNSRIEPLQNELANLRSQRANVLAEFMPGDDVLRVVRIQLDADAVAVDVIESPRADPPPPGPGGDGSSGDAGESPASEVADEASEDLG